MSNKGREKLPWTIMLAEDGARERIQRERPEAVQLLDYFETRLRPFTNGTGWTVFNDWLDQCYFDRKGTPRPWPPKEVPFVGLDDMRRLVFPASR